MSGKLLHVFWDTDMRGRHEALADRAKKERKFRVEDLKPGDVLAFVNRSRDRVMVLSGLEEADTYGVLSYYRSPHGRIDEMAIQYIPQSFRGGKLHMDDATREALLERLRKKRRVNAKK